LLSVLSVQQTVHHAPANLLRLLLSSAAREIFVVWWGRNGVRGLQTKSFS